VTNKHELKNTRVKIIQKKKMFFLCLIVMFYVNAECLYPQYIKTIKFNKYEDNSFECRGHKCYLTPDTVYCDSVNYNTSINGVYWNCRFDFLKEPEFYDYFVTNVHLNCNKCRGLHDRKIDVSNCNLDFYIIKNGRAMNKYLVWFIACSSLYLTCILIEFVFGDKVPITSAYILCVVFMFIVITCTCLTGNYYYTDDEFAVNEVTKIAVECLFMFPAKLFTYWLVTRSTV